MINRVRHVTSKETYTAFEQLNPTSVDQIRTHHRGVHACAACVQELMSQAVLSSSIMHYPYTPIRSP